MAKFGTIDVRGLLAAVLLGCTGCGAQWCHLPDDCAHAFRHTQLGWEIQDVCNNCPLDCLACGPGVECGCDVYVDDEAVWLDEPCAPGEPPCRNNSRVVVGPPPVGYEPPMPPKFLPVPARSVFTNVNINAPTIQRGQVEVGYGPSIAFPAGE